MHHLLGAAVVACAALSAGVEARMLRWEADANDMHWLPPRETAGLQHQLGGGTSPMPTPAPLPPRQLLEKRSGTNNTCAYVSGSFGMKARDLARRVRRPWNPLLTGTIL